MKKNLIIAMVIVSISIMFTSCNGNLKLKNGEKLEYQYDTESQSYVICKVSENKKQECLIFEDSYEGGVQISSDQKCMILFKNKTAFYRPAYFLDGNSGKLTFIGEIPYTAKMDLMGKYILYEVKYSTGLFSVINLKTFERIYDFQMPVKEIEKWVKRGAGFSYYRTKDNSEYDFCINFDIELLSIAKAYFNVSQKNGFVEYDDSELTEVQLRPRS